MFIVLNHENEVQYCVYMLYYRTILHTSTIPLYYTLVTCTVSHNTKASYCYLYSHCVIINDLQLLITSIKYLMQFNMA